MAISKSDLIYSLTTTGLLVAQSDTSKSLGGYISSTNISSTITDLFDGYFNDSIAQYRCIALQNTNATQTAHGVSFYLSEAAANAAISIAVEMPQTDAVMGTASAGTLLSFTDATIPGVYGDNAFDNCAVLITSGANAGEVRLVSSYDSSLTTVVVNAQFLNAMADTDTYTILPAPASAVVSGQVTPDFGSGNISALSAPTVYTSAIDIDVTGSRVNGSDLRPSDIVYIWLERKLKKNLAAFDDNSAVLAMRFSY